MTIPRLSVLDLAPIPAGSDARDALANAAALARHARNRSATSAIGWPSTTT